MAKGSFGIMSLVTVIKTFQDASSHSPVATITSLAS